MIALLKMPKGVLALFFVQIFSTIAFSVLSSTLVLYLGFLHFSDGQATELMATFMAFNFVLHLLGGYGGGRFLSFRKLFIVGMVLQTVGCLMISQLSVASLYEGLALFLTGAGLNVTCVNCLVTQLFESADKRRESAFLWNYSGMNVGFLVGFAIAGVFQLKHDYHPLFLFSAVTNLIAMTLVIFHWHSFADRGTILSMKNPIERKRSRAIGLGLIALLAVTLFTLLKDASLSMSLVVGLGILMGVVVITLACIEKSQIAKRKLWSYLVLTLAAFTFFVLYQIEQMGLVLFVQRNVARHVLGFVIAPQWFLNINSLVIIMGGPLLASALKKARERGLPVSIPLQFSIGLILMGVGYLLLVIAIHCSGRQGMSHVSIVAVTYVFLSLAELSISPIGYAMIGELVPKRLQGLFMGIWMMTTGVAAPMANYFSDAMRGASGSINPLVTNISYLHVFRELGLAAILVGTVLLLIRPRLRMWMGLQENEQAIQ